MSNNRIRVLCVDDHTIVREGINLLIGRQPDIEVVGSAASGEEAVSLFKKIRPDVTLMDLQLPTMSGLEAIHAIRTESPDARIVVLTMYHGDEHIRQALEAGAVSYILKDALCNDLVQLIRQVNNGHRPMPPAVQALLAGHTGHSTLTPRETEVIELIAQGMRNKEVAMSLGISQETAQVHVKNIFAKLGVQDRTAAVGVALRRGIIRIPQ